MERRLVYVGTGDRFSGALAHCRKRGWNPSSSSGREHWRIYIDAEHYEQARSELEPFFKPKRQGRVRKVMSRAERRRRRRQVRMQLGEN